MTRLEQRPDADDLPHRDWTCDECGAANSMRDGDCQFCDGPTPEPEPPLFFTVAIYDANRAYGGPEEGGWWYDCGTLVADLEAPRIFTDRDEASAYARELTTRLDKEHNDPRGYRADLSSVCCTGRYVARVCDGYPEPHYPAQRPHYE